MSKGRTRIEIDKETQEALEIVAKRENITTDEAAELVIIGFVKTFDPEFVESHKDDITPKVLKILEKQS